MTPGPRTSPPPADAEGILVIVGGAEDKKNDKVVFQTTLAEVKGRAERVVVIAAASREPRETAEPYLHAFKEMGVRYVDQLPLQSRAEAGERRTLDLLRDADVIFFTGGDQVRLVETLRETEALEVIKKRYREGAVIAGTSAGAAAMSTVMLARGSVEEGLTKGNVKTEFGLGLLPNTVIDTHFVQRGRFGRLLQIVTGDPSCTGIGISEDTAIVVRKGGREFEVVGSDSVIVFDGSHVLHTNAREAHRGQALIVAGATIHALAEGCRYDFKTREVTVPNVGTVAVDRRRA